MGLALVLQPTGRPKVLCNLESLRRRKGGKEMTGLVSFLKQYWSVAAGIGAALTAILTAIIKWQTVQKNRREAQLQAAEASRSGTGMAFEKIRVDRNNSYWREWLSPDGISETLRTPIDSSSCKQFFHVNQVVEGADPSFDVLLRNNTRRELSILGVGVRIVRASHYSYEFLVGGLIEEANKLATSETLCVEMPELFQEICHHNFDEGDPPVETNRIVRTDCDPYLLPPEGRFRYTLVLMNYRKMPNNVILRLWVETSEGDRESHDLYLRYALRVAD